MCSVTSPRISFSRDLVQAEGQNDSRRDTMLLESNPEFEFITSSCSESCSADELFYNGVILPVDRISKHVQKCRPPPTLPPLPPVPKTEQLMVVGYEEKQTHHHQQQQSKSFWGFKRSSSLNSDVKKSLICNLPILPRSNSTGSVSNKQRLKDKKNNKGYMGSYGNGVKISPVLNVPPPYISKGTATLFGLGSLLRSGKRDKKNKKWYVRLLNHLILISLLC